MRFDFSGLLSSSASGVLRSRAFFDDLHALSFALHPLKKAIADLESRNCTLSDCFIGLIQLALLLKNYLIQITAYFGSNQLLYSIEGLMTLMTIPIFYVSFYIRITKVRLSLFFSIIHYYSNILFYSISFCPRHFSWNSTYRR